jgi:uncharacterized membrane protein (DUF2068 family)
MGPPGLLLLAVVCVACAFAAFGLWRGRIWGYWLAVVMLGVHLVADVVNVALGIEPRALVGVPIVALILAFLATARVRRFFRQGPHDA